MTILHCSLAEEPRRMSKETGVVIQNQKDGSIAEKSLECHASMS
jgi:hypothetical protein